MALYFAGWFAIAVALLVAQMRFYNAHQRAHNLWPPRADQWVLTRSAAEYRAMLRVTFRRDADPRVERRRRQYVGVLVVAVAYLALGLPVVWLLS